MRLASKGIAMMDAFQKQCLAPTGQPQARSMLIVEDDERLKERLARAMEARGFQVMIAGSVFEGLAQIHLSAPKYAVVDLRFEDGCGLDGNIATAVKAAKLGAIDYLTKPVDADDIVSALQAPLGGKAEAPQRPVSPANVRLQHIQQVHEASGRNVLETARRLNMHRRTLQRILSRRAG
jgi:two-component system, response regulator RegA